MCCSAWPTIFSQTITGTWEVMVDGGLKHVLWYQNRVGRGMFGGMVFEVIVRQALAGAAWKEICAGPMKVNEITIDQVQDEVNRRAKLIGREDLIVPTAPKPRGQGNCLIIPLLGAWDSIRLLNTMSTPDILKDVSQALQPPVMRSEAAAFAGSYGASGGSIIFMKFDIYDIVLAEFARDIPGVLPQIVDDKRPAVNESVFRTLDQWYQCPVAVCCFNDADSGESKPLAFAFEPLYPDKIVVYTLDAHDGNAPVPDAMVRLDHTIFVGSYLTETKHGATIHYTDQIPADLRPYLLDHAMGVTVSKNMENGDFTFLTSAVRAGEFEGLRTLPPKAPAGLPRLGQTITRTYEYVAKFQRINDD